MRFANDTAAAPAPPAAAAPSEPQRAAGAPSPTPPVSAPLGGGPDFTKIAGQAVKGVANISSVQVVRRPNSPFDNDPFFQYFFGDQDFSGSRDRRSLSLGSGVIIDENGYLVTNDHVVRRADKIQIQLATTRTVYEAKLVASDPKLRAEAAKLARPVVDHAARANDERRPRERA